MTIIEYEIIEVIMALIIVLLLTHLLKQYKVKK